MLCEPPETRQRIDVETALTLLGDSYARELLCALEEEPATAAELVERCSGSKVTVYRRLNSLCEAGLIESATRIQRDGNHCTVYRDPIGRILISLEDGQFDVELEE